MLILTSPPLVLYFCWRSCLDVMRYMGEGNMEIIFTIPEGVGESQPSYVKTNSSIGPRTKE